MKKRILWSAAAAGVIGLIVMVWLLDIPSWTELDMEKLTNLSQTTMVYDSQGQPIAELHSGQNRLNISIEDVPEHVKNAFIAIEDARFYEHCGVDLWRIGGAILNNIKAGGYSEGASTITQQLIKLTHLTSEKKLSRKAQEAWLALQLEKRASKDEILEMYLNVVYFGKGAYGIEAAAQAYFGKKCQELTLTEGAALAGIIKAPGVYAPHISMERSVERRNLVLDAMERQKMISPEEAATAKEEPVQLIDSSENTYESGWYVDAVLEEAGNVLSCSVEDVLAGGFRIYTALNVSMQEAAEEIYSEDSYFPGNASDGIRPESSLIALDPDNGEIYCMIGGRSYDTRRGLNRALHISRQPGSAFKPISVYAAAIDFLGFTPISLIEDSSRDFGNGYTPSNASGSEYGTVTLRQALARSMNLATVDLITRTGIETAALYAERAGIPLVDSDRNLSLALGSLTKGVSPAQMSAAYAPLVNGGHSVSAHTIRRIEDLYGNTVYEYTFEDRYVMNAKSARMITSMLEDAVSYGTAKQLAKISFPVAAKTGTVGYAAGGNRDAWTVAYTPEVSIAVWMGFDQTDDLHILPEGTTGGTYPARLAAAFLEKTAAEANGGEFFTPDGMTSVLIDAKALSANHTAMLASERTPAKYLLNEILPADQLPLLTSDLWNEPTAVEAIYVQTDPSSGLPAISFIATDSYSKYRILRKNGMIQTEVGCIVGKAGEYVTFLDEGAEGISTAEYSVVARHIGFMEEGQIVESRQSPWVEYNAPGILEKLLLRDRMEEEGTELPMFQE